MLPIIFILLKIIGIMLLVLLGIIVFLILVISFVPIRYSAAVKKETTINANARIVWLLHFIAIKIQFVDGKTSFSVSILGKNLLGEKKSKKKAIESETNNIKETDTKQNEIQNQIPQEEIIQKEKIPEEKVPEEKVPEEKVPEESNLSSAKSKRINLFSTLKEKILNFKNMIQNLIRSLKDKIKNISETINKIKFTIRKYTDFWHLQATQNAFRHICKELKYLLKHTMPRKANGYVYFGFDDPATTGEILGILYLASIWWPDTFELVPDFENKAFQCDAEIEGHIRICHFIKIVLALLADSNIRKTFFTFRNLRTS